MLRSVETEHPRLTNREIFSKNSNLCHHNPPMSLTDEQTDDMRLQDRALHCSASCGKNA